VNRLDAPLIVLEGIDGSGKTSALRHVEVGFEGREDIALTSEPTEEFRGVVDDVPTTLERFCEDRVRHADELAEMAADSDAAVCDRYADSTRAYQTAALIAEGWIAHEAREYVHEVMGRYEWPEPDLTIYLDCPSGLALERLCVDHEYEYAEMLQLAQEEYQRLYDPCDTDTRIIDATQDSAVVGHQVAASVKTAIETDDEGISDAKRRGGKTYADAVDETE
jgi:thymidylate kinase